MSSDRVVSLLTGAVLSATLVTLVLASFVLPLSPAVAAFPSDAAAVPLLVAHDERAAPAARAVPRVRDDSPVDIAPLVVAQEPADPAPLVTPAAPVAATPVAPTAAPVVTRAVPAPVAVDVTPATLAAEARMLVLMNTSRQQAGLVALVTDANVVAAARAHSAVEAQYRYVYHDGPDGSARSRDATACGTGWYGENTGKVWQDNVDRLHIEFMSEPWEPINHRTNVMDPLFRRVGVGAVQGPDALYMTMVFCR